MDSVGQQGDSGEVTGGLASRPLIRAPVGRLSLGFPGSSVSLYLRSGSQSAVCPAPSWSWFTFSALWRSPAGRTGRVPRNRQSKSKELLAALPAVSRAWGLECEVRYVRAPFAKPVAQEITVMAYERLPAIAAR